MKLQSLPFQSTHKKELMKDNYCCSCKNNCTNRRHKRIGDYVCDINPFHVRRNGRDHIGIIECVASHHRPAVQIRFGDGIDFRFLCDIKKLSETQVLQFVLER